jgi:hypothetical protein
MINSASKCLKITLKVVKFPKKNQVESFEGGSYLAETLDAPALHAQSLKANFQNNLPVLSFFRSERPLPPWSACDLSAFTLTPREMPVHPQTNHKYCGRLPFVSSQRRWWN